MILQCFLLIKHHILISWRINNHGKLRSNINVKNNVLAQNTQLSDVMKNTGLDSEYIKISLKC